MFFYNNRLLLELKSKIRIYIKYLNQIFLHFLNHSSKIKIKIKCFPGVISTQAIKMDDIIMDYHGIEYTGSSGKQHINSLMESDDKAMDYLLEIIGPPYRVIDASSEICNLHPDNRCMGRLANHVTIKQNGEETNMKVTEIYLSAIKPQERVVVFKARRDILPFEQLRFDYGDPRAREMFHDDNELSQLLDNGYFKYSQSPSQSPSTPDTN